MLVAVLICHFCVLHTLLTGSSCLPCMGADPWGGGGREGGGRGVGVGVKWIASHLPSLDHAPA